MSGKWVRRPCSSLQHLLDAAMEKLVFWQMFPENATTMISASYRKEGSLCFVHFFFFLNYFILFLFHDKISSGQTSFGLLDVRTQADQPLSCVYHCHSFPHCTLLILMWFLTLWSFPSGCEWRCTVALLSLFSLVICSYDSYCWAV